MFVELNMGQTPLIFNRMRLLLKQGGKHNKNMFVYEFDVSKVLEILYPGFSWSRLIQVILRRRYRIVHTTREVFQITCRASEPVVRVESDSCSGADTAVR